jgi:hypothetical protein
MCVWVHACTRCTAAAAAAAAAAAIASVYVVAVVFQQQQQQGEAVLLNGVCGELSPFSFCTSHLHFSARAHTPV